VQRGFGAGYAAGGGGGGGAIFIAANNQISISSTGGILARGGNGGNFRSGEATGGAGSGGAIRLLANVVTASLGAQIKATGGTFNHQGGDGRIRIERNNTDLFSGGITPTPSLGLPREVFPPVGSPVCRILMIGSSTVTTDPRAGLGLGGETDLMLQTSDPTTIVIETEGVSTDWRVFLRVTGAIGPASEIEITSPTNPLVFTSGQNMQARVSALIDLPDGYTALQARAVHPTMAP
jgi:hypothetical protein